jgi:hypothetical protein
MPLRPGWPLLSSLVDRQHCQRLLGGMALESSDIKILLRNFVIEVAIYALLVVVYFFLVLRLLGKPLESLFENNIVLYAFVALFLIVAQGVLLDGVTTFLINRLGLVRLE